MNQCQVKPTYKVNRISDSGDTCYLVKREGMQTVMIIKSDLYAGWWKPVSNHLPYFRTLRDAIFGVLNDESPK